MYTRGWGWSPSRAIPSLHPHVWSPLDGNVFWCLILTIITKPFFPTLIQWCDPGKKESLFDVLLRGNIAQEKAMP